MKNKLALILVLSYSSLSFAAMPIASADEPAGKAVFTDKNCNSCHSVMAQQIERSGDLPPGNNPPPDLSDEGNKRSSEWLEKWIRREEELNGKKHLKRWSGSDDDFKSLITWLSSLKSEPKK